MASPGARLFAPAGSRGRVGAAGVAPPTDAGAYPCGQAGRTRKTSYINRSGLADRARFAGQQGDSTSLVLIPAGSESLSCQFGRLGRGKRPSYPLKGGYTILFYL